MNTAAQSDIFTPFLGMMSLTGLVWLWLFVRRLGYILPRQIDAEKLKTPDMLQQHLPETVMAPSYNLQNLFELPVIFYALCLFLYTANMVDSVFVGSAYIFFVARALHTIVHCSYNKVMHRFLLYLLSSLALWFMLARVIWISV